MTQIPPNKDELVIALHSMGNDPYRIASSLKCDVVYVKRVIRSLSTTTTFTNLEDKEIADAMRNLAWRALDEALDIYDKGHPTEKFGLTKTILARVASLVGAQTTTRYDDMRNELEEILSGHRGTDAPLETPDEYETQSEITAFTGNFDDPDEGTYN